MWKKASKKKAPTVSPHPSTETDAILSKIDASVYQRQNDRGMPKDRTVTDISYISPQPAQISRQPISPVKKMNQMLQTTPPKQDYTMVYQNPQQLLQHSTQIDTRSISVPSLPDHVINKPVPKSPLSQQSVSPRSFPSSPAAIANPTVLPTPPRSPASNKSHLVYKPKKEDITEFKAPFSLSEHLFQFAFLDGKFSDIALIMKGHTYHLHKIVLCRFKFFEKIFIAGSPSLDEKIIEIEFDDTNITSESIEIVLASMYGLVCPLIQDENPEFTAITSANLLNVLAAAFFFEHKKLLDYCLDYALLYELSPHQYRTLALEKFPDIKEVKFPTSNKTILRYIEFIDGFDYGSISEQLEDALLNYLCFEGCSHLESLFVDLPLGWLERVLEADAFWCPNEYTRYQFAKSVILQRRMNSLQVDASDRKDETERTAEQVYEEIFRFAIIYTHMTFEQLNEVRADNFVAENILMKCFWQQTRFRSNVENAQEGSTSLLPEEEPSQKPSAGARDDQSSKNDLIVPIRLGVEFKEFHDLQDGERKYSSTFFYGGNWWSIFLQKFPSSADENGEITKPQKWGLFLRRSEGADIMSIAVSSGAGDETTTTDPLTGTTIEKSVSYYMDKRTMVKAVFKLFNPAIKSYDPIFESKPNDYTETQSWGFRSKDQVVGEMDLRLKELEMPSVVRLSVVMKYM